MLKEKIKELAEAFHAEIIEIRRHLHRHPELSYQEVETGKYISEKLSGFGIPHEHGWAENGIVGLIQGEKKGAGKVIALRADMDALPIREANEVPYKSIHEGIMHACGHDVHTASLLGTVKILHRLKSEFAGSVKFIFQPAEEKFPGGASILIDEGVLKNPAPACIFGQHVHPSLESGKVGMRAGMFMASADEIYVWVKGRGGHGATPHECIDPVLIASHIVVALQQLVSRNANPVVPTVLTFGKIDSVGGSTNIIPNEVKLEGTFRTMNEQWREQAHQRMKKLAESIAESMGGTCQFKIAKGYPFLVNDEALTFRARRYASEYLGKDSIVELPVRMTSEDFAYYSQLLPACFYRLGTGNAAKGITAAVHTDRFDIDENALKTGIGLMAWLAIQEMAS